MRLIYVDEAGTSANESVTVVAGIIVDPDTEWRPAVEMLSNLKDKFVPAEYRDGFVYHGADVFRTEKKNKYPNWSMDSRIAFALALMRLPNQLGIPIVMSMVRRDSFPRHDKIEVGLFHHAVAFQGMVHAANNHISQFGRPNETSVLVAEHIPDRHKQLRGVLQNMRDAPVTLTPDMQNPTQMNRAMGTSPKTMTMGAETVLDTAHFVEKGYAPLLEVADALAYGFRKYFARLPGGDQCKEAMVINLHMPDYAGSVNMKCFYWWLPILLSRRGQPVPLGAEIAWRQPSENSDTPQKISPFFPTTRDWVAFYLWQAEFVMYARRANPLIPSINIVFKSPDPYWGLTPSRGSDDLAPL